MSSYAQSIFIYAMNIIYRIYHFLSWNNDDIFLIVTQINVQMVPLLIGPN